MNLLELMKVREWLSVNLAHTGQATEAIAQGQEAIERARALAADTAATPESWRELPRAYASMAATFEALGKREESRNLYRAATAEWEKMASKGVSLPDSQDEIDAARKGAAK